MKTDAQKYSIVTADETAGLFARHLKSRTPFIYLRYGDGALECMNGLGRGGTCDGEPYSSTLADALLTAWKIFMLGPCKRVYAGDWLSASFGDDRSNEYREEYNALIHSSHMAPLFVHFEGLLLMRKSEELLDFYRAAKADTRKKIYVGPAACRDGAKLLGAQFFEVPMTGLFENIGPISKALRNEQFDVMYWGAGMAGSIAVSEAYVHHPNKTFINLGSALDPLYRGRTRKTQLTKAEAMDFLKELL